MGASEGEGMRRRGKSGQRQGLDEEKGGKGEGRAGGATSEGRKG